MNYLKLFFSLFILFSPITLKAIDSVLGVENTFKLKGEESLYYGFAEGDQIIFDFQETNKKSVKEIEIVEMPNNTKFQDFKVSNVNQKTIKVHKNAIYLFRFKNPAIASRICKVKIQRIPSDSSKINFDTGWRYEDVKDTTYVPYTEDSIVGYEERHYTEVVKELKESHVEEYEILNHTTEVQAIGLLANRNPRAILTFELPKNVKNELKEQKVVSWAFWFATGDDAESFWVRNKKRLVNLSSTLVGAYTSPLGAFAAGAMVDMIIPAAGQRTTVKYSITDVHNAHLFMNGSSYRTIHQGSGSGGHQRFTSIEMTNGKYALCLYNPNTAKSIRVMAKGIALVEVKTYQFVEYERVKSVPMYVRLNKKRMVVNSRQIMMLNGK